MHSEPPAFPPRPRRLTSAVPWLACIIVAGCGILGVAYWLQTRLPREITIAGGPSQGRYDVLARELAAEIKRRLGVEVNVKETHGSLDNLAALESGAAQLGLYQSETRAILLDQNPGDPAQPALDRPLFVANLYPEYLIPVTAVGRQFSMAELNDRTITCNDRKSGDFALLRLLLDHLGGHETHRVKTIPYVDMPAALGAGDVDLAVISCGLGAPVLSDVLRDGAAELVEIPFLGSLVSRNAALLPRTIPAGYFRSFPTPVPATDFHTVATQAQLLAAENAPVRLVETATEIILDPGFQRRIRLNELNRGGQEFAMARPEFPLHPGAAHIYSPELRPLLNPDFVEGTEGIRSFLVSVVVALWLAHRWWKRRLLLSQEHRLDRYIRDLLQIERDQIGVDGVCASDAETLQRMLDRVTDLRQNALSEFTAHELKEDQAVDCFVEMCHALSDKISGKLTRHTLRSLMASFPASDSGSPDPDRGPEVS